MAQPPIIKDPNILLNMLAGLSKLEPMTKTTRKRRVKKRGTSKNEKIFLEALIEFKRNGYDCTWSTRGSWVIIELFGVPRSYNGFKAAAKALLDRKEQWNNQD